MHLWRDEEGMGHVWGRLVEERVVVWSVSRGKHARTRERVQKGVARTRQEGAEHWFVRDESRAHAACAVGEGSDGGGVAAAPRHGGRVERRGERVRVRRGCSA